MIVFHETSLRRTLTSYFDYYHRSRTHLSLGKDAPDPRAIHPPEMGSVVALPLVGGLQCTTATNDGLPERARIQPGCMLRFLTVCNSLSEQCRRRVRSGGFVSPD